MYMHIYAALRLQHFGQKQQKQQAIPNKQKAILIWLAIGNDNTIISKYEEISFSNIQYLLYCGYIIV